MIGLREDQRMKASMVNFLNHTASHCRSELVVASKLACAGVRSAPDKAGSSCAVEREQAPSPQQARYHISIHHGRKMILSGLPLFTSA